MKVSILFIRRYPDVCTYVVHLAWYCNITSTNEDNRIVYMEASSFICQERYLQKYIRMQSVTSDSRVFLLSRARVLNPAFQSHDRIDVGHLLSEWDSVWAALSIAWINFAGIDEGNFSRFERRACDAWTASHLTEPSEYNRRSLRKFKLRALGKSWSHGIRSFKKGP